MECQLLSVLEYEDGRDVPSSVHSRYRLQGGRNFALNVTVIRNADKSREICVLACIPVRQTRCVQTSCGETVPGSMLNS